MNKEELKEKLFTKLNEIKQICLEYNSNIDHISMFSLKKDKELYGYEWFDSITMFCNDIIMNSLEKFDDDYDIGGDD